MVTKAIRWLHFFAIINTYYIEVSCSLEAAKLKTLEARITVYDDLFRTKKRQITCTSMRALCTECAFEMASISLNIILARILPYSRWILIREYRFEKIHIFYICFNYNSHKKHSCWQWFVWCTNVSHVCIEYVISSRCRSDILQTWKILIFQLYPQNNIHHEDKRRS